MWVKSDAATTAVRAKQCHACDSSEMLTKTEMVLIQASMHQRDKKRSLKSSIQHSYEVKHKMCQKHSVRHEKWAYPKRVELNVLTTPICNDVMWDVKVRKVDVMNELCSVQLMSFDKIEVVTHMPQIYGKRD